MLPDMQDLLDFPTPTTELLARGSAGPAYTLPALMSATRKMQASMVDMAHDMQGLKDDFAAIRQLLEKADSHVPMV